MKSPCHISSPREQESFTEYFQELRAEAEDFLTAQKPISSAHVRKLSAPTCELQGQLEELLCENEGLRKALADMRAENAKLKQQLAWKIQASPSSVEETRGEDLSPAHHLLLAAAAFEADVGQMTPATERFSALETQHMNLQQFPSMCFEQCRRELLTPRSDQQNERVRQLRYEVKKHKAFIKELKDTLVKVLEERKRERAAHKDLKAEVLRLRKKASVVSGEPTIAGLPS